MQALSSGKRALTIVGTLVVSVAIALAIALIVQRLTPLGGGLFNRFWFAHIATCLFVVGSLVLNRDWFSTRPENVYLIVVLSVSLLFVWCNSVRTVGWDTGIHYRNTLYFVGGQGDVALSESDVMFINDGPDVLGEDDRLQSINAYENELDVRDANAAESIERPQNPLWYVTSVEYVPYALVVTACKLLGVSFSHRLLLMRACGAVFYSFVTYLGMRKLRERKMLYASVALLPTSVFLAAELGYSYWLFSLCLYGFACLVGMRQGSVPVTVVTLLKMLGALLLGMLPRVVYFPLMFLCLLVPTERFSSKRRARLFRALLVTAALGAFCVWLIPRLMSGFGTGDARGGGDISPAGQISHILSHPLEYLSVFSRFVLPPLSMEGGGADVEGFNLVGGFLSIEASPGLLANYGYLVRTHWVYTAILWVLLVVTTLTDKSHERREGVLPGLVAFVLTFGVFVMIVTALYFDFTPVGLGEIHGVQRRYLVPLIFPFLTFFGPSALGIHGNPSRTNVGRYNAAVLCSLAAVLLVSWWTSNMAFVA